MSSNGAWFGDHSEQLEDMYQTILSSEKKEGKEITLKDRINIRQDIADAYDELIDCFSKEGADASIITYAVNLMKDSVSNSNDLRNIAQLAVAISESTIGALYMVDHLQRRRDERSHESEIYFEVNHEVDEIDKLIERIEVDVSPEIIDEICTEENETEFSKLLKRAREGDDSAKISINVINRAANYLLRNPNGKGRDIGALSLVSKLMEIEGNLGQPLIEQLIDQFDLEKYDIFTMTDGDKPVVDAEKLKSEIGSQIEKKNLVAKVDEVVGINRMQNLISGKDMELNKYTTLEGIFDEISMNIASQRFYENLRKLKNKPEAVKEFVGLNMDVASVSLQNQINMANNIPNGHKSSDTLYKNIYMISEAMKEIKKEQSVQNADEPTFSATRTTSEIWTSR